MHLTSDDLALDAVAPWCPDNVLGHLVETRVPGVEEWRDGWYRRALLLPHGPAIVAVTPTRSGVRCRLLLQHPEDVEAAVAGVRFVLDLAADVPAITARLAADPVLAPLVAATPGRRVPRAWDAGELAIRAVLGQQVSTKAARTHAARLVAATGVPVDDPEGGLTHLFPAPGRVATAPDEALAMPGRRRATVRTLAAALATGKVDLSTNSSFDSARRQVLDLPGIGRWTAEIVAMRGLGDPDAFPATDLGIIVGARALGLPDRERALLQLAERWRPWRAYAAQYLWAAIPHAINAVPVAPMHQEAPA